ncbi:osmoprotectant transport system permease protein [Scopulibacillus daqui]|uniref:Osmoprotectant transport system permease protein n=1 Tax=Scopulibacillus daqui TaxID=1469162 RepID=A0ABS2PXZ9_9BACL|nr:ABC transporter permease [Scopulibacillus daqui]MBM7644928.1 osmoprotectant transport system permease protein [Scopulibacillus daqui]
MDSVIKFLSQNWSEILIKSWEHLYISLAAVLLGIIIAIPLGIVLTRVPKIAGFVMGIVGVIQTFPSLAILAFFIPVLGVGQVPAIIALFVYALLPILRNTYIGVRSVNKGMLEAGRGMGMTSWQRIVHVELPLAVPVIMAGVRLSTVYLIGWATLASYIGAGGLGDYIFDGLNLFRTDYIIAGSVPAIILALIADLLLGRLERWVTPKGIRNSKEAI